MSMTKKTKNQENKNYNIFSECTDCKEEISCFKKIAGVLSDVEIKKLNLIKNAKEDKFNPTVYDLSLGNFHYVYGKPNNLQNSGSIENCKSWIPVCIGSDNALAKQNKTLSEEEKFIRQDKNKTKVLTIPPLGSALIELEEIIDTYSVAKKDNVLVTGRFDLKLTLVNKGLISQQGTQVEPCYKGRLYCFVHNLSNKAIELTQGDSIASIEFSYVSCFCNLEKRKEVIRKLIDKNEKRYLEADYCDEGKGILNVRYFNREKHLPDSCGLAHISDVAVSAIKEQQVIDSITQEVKSKVDKKTTIICAIITAIASILVALIAGYFAFVLPLTKETKVVNDSLNNPTEEETTYIQEQPLVTQEETLVGESDFEVKQ